MLHLQIRYLILLPVFAIAGWLALLSPSGMPDGAAPAGALVVLCIGFWATGIISEHLVAMLLFFLAMVFSVAPPETVFSGFASGAFWLVLGGLIIGAAVDVTGLGKRLARAITARISGGYGSIIVGIVLVSVVLIFLMPSTLSRDHSADADHNRAGRPAWISSRKQGAKRHGVGDDSDVLSLLGWRASGECSE